MWSMACMAKLKVMNSKTGFRPTEAGANRNPGEPMFGDGGVDHAPVAKLVQAALGSLYRRPGIQPPLRPSRRLHHQRASLLPWHRAMLRGRSWKPFRWPAGISGISGHRKPPQAEVRQPPGLLQVQVPARPLRRRVQQQVEGRQAAASAADASSPSARTIAIGVFTFTPSEPSATRILPTVPSSTVSTSMVALSVSISAMMSPEARSDRPLSQAISQACPPPLWETGRA